MPKYTNEFEIIFNNLQDGAVLADTKTRKFYNANKTFCKMLGYTLDEVKKLSVNDIHPKKDLPYVISQFELQVKRKIYVAKNLPVKRKDGTVFYADVGATFLKIRDKTYLVGIFRDVTEYKKMVEALKQSEQRYRLLAENVTDIIWTMDMDFKLTYESPSVENMRGFSVDEALSQSLKEILTGESYKVAKKALSEEMEYESKRKKGQPSRPPRVLELEHTCKDGSTVWAEVSANFLRDADGKAIGIVGITRDISERRLEEERLDRLNITLLSLGSDFNENIKLLTKACAKGLKAGTALYNRLGDKNMYVVGSWNAPKDLSFKGKLKGRVCYDAVTKGKRGKPFIVKNLDETSYRKTDPNVKKYNIKTYMGFQVSCFDKPIGVLCVTFRKNVDFSNNDLKILSIFAEAVGREEERRLTSEENLALKQQMEFVLGVTKTGLDIIDSEFNIHYIDPEWKKIYGDFKGKKCYEYFMGRRSMCPYCGVIEALRIKRAVVYEELLPRENNRIIQVTSIPFKDNDGNWKVAEVSVDITERKKAKEALQDSENKYKALYASSRDAIMMLTPKEKFFSGNSSTLKMFKCKNEKEFISKTPAQLSPKYQPDGELSSVKAQKMMDIAMKNGSHFFEWKHKRVDGEEFFATVLLTRMEIKGEKVLQATVRDITERKRMEEVILESESKYRTIFENTGTATMIIEKDLLIVMVNVEFKELFGFSKKETEGKKSALDFIVDDYKDKVQKYHRLRMIDPESVPRNYEIEVKDKKGNIKEMFLTVAPIPGTERSVVSFSDITEIKRKELELSKQKELLDNTNKALEHKLKELQEAIGHIKKLEGLVPICARCKKMLTEGGNPKDPKAWMSLEKYISERSEASFTHGICPECMAKMYGKATGNG